MDEREKIAQIIAEHLCPQGKAHKTLYGAERRCYSRDNFAECEKVSKCVDALIAANIGDVTEWKERAEKHRFMALPDGRIKQLYSDEEVWDIARQRDEYKHRAEVAERSLRRKCEIEADSTCPCDENSDKCKECAENRLCSTKYATQCYYEKAIQQAEREIEEEKNENNKQN